MKRYSIAVAAAALALAVAGCTTQKRVATLEGRGTTRIYTANFDQAWRATVDAAQFSDLEIMRSDRSRGFIGVRRSIQPHTFGENVGIWVREVGPLQTEVEVVSRQAGPPVASWRNWENEIHRAIAANLTRETTGVGAAPRSTVIERGTGGATVIVPETRGTVVIPESRRTIVVPESTARDALRAEERQRDTLRTRQEAGERALANEVDETKRQMLQREIDRLREEQRLQQERIQELERQIR